MFLVIFWTALVRYTWPSNSSRFFFPTISTFGCFWSQCPCCVSPTMRCGRLPSRSDVNNSWVRTTFGRSDVVSCGRRKGLRTLSKVSKTWRFCSRLNYNHHYTLHYTPIHYNYSYSCSYNYNYTTFHYTTLITLHYNNYTTLQLQLQLKLHYITLHYTTLITLHSTPIQSTPLHSTPLH